MPTPVPSVIRLAIAWAAAVMPCAIAATPLIAQETASTTTDAKTHTVGRGPFQLDVSVDGTLEAKQMTPIVVRPEVWKELTVLSAVPHGQRVSKGDVLVTLDLRNLDRAIAEQTQARELAMLKLAQAEEELKLLEKSTPLDLEQNERAKRILDEDLQLFLGEDLEQYRKSAEFSLKRAKAYVENEEEELTQLEKMYEADDLTEETEEIVLKRQREAVEQARFYYDEAQRDHERLMKYQLPRLEQSRKFGAAAADITYAKSKLSLPALLKQAQLELQTQQYAQKKSDQALADLKADREHLNIVAPVDGIVYYGKCTAGQWTPAATVGERLQMGGSLAPHDVLMTIVTPGAMWLRGTIDEKDLANLRVGLAGEAVPTAMPDARVPVQLADVSAVPVAAGKFDVRFDATLGDQADRLAAGMGAKVKLVVYRNENAVTVPASAVFTDDGRPDEHLVFIQAEPGKHEKRMVTVAHKNDKQAEISAGLSGGETILAENPEKESK